MRVRDVCLSFAGAAAFVVGFLSFSPARAVFEPARFDPLLTEFLRRRDTTFNGTLTKTQKKQKSAVVGSVQAIEAPAADLRGDVAAARSALAAISKAYPAEFGATPDPAPLEGQFVDLFASLEGRLRVERPRLLTYAGSLTGSTRAKFEAQRKKIDAAFEALVALDPRNLSGRGGQLKKLAAAIVKADGILRKAPPTGFSALVDGIEWDANAFAGGTYFEGDQTIYLVGSRTLPSGSRELIQLYLRPVPGTGVYPLADPGNLRANFHTEPGTDPNGTQVIWDIVPGSGALVVDTLDVPGRRIRARLSFSAFNNGAGSKTISDAVIDIGGNDLTIETGDGF